MKETERGETEEGSITEMVAIFQNLPVQKKNIQDRIKGGFRIKKLVFRVRKEWNMTPDSKKGESLKTQSINSVAQRARLVAIPWTAARQFPLSITNSWSLLKLKSIESVMPSNHLILSHPLLLPPSVFSSIWVFSNELVLLIRWPKYWSFSFNISPSNDYSGHYM